MSVSTCFTTFTSAGGGGGGGGGGGATKAIMSCAFGNASVNSSGIRTIMPTITACSPKENAAVAGLLVFSLPPDSIKLSSNISFLPAQTYDALDTGHPRFAPSSCLFCKQQQRSKIGPSALYSFQRETPALKPMP